MKSSSKTKIYSDYSIIKLLIIIITLVTSFLIYNYVLQPCQKEHFSSNYLDLFTYKQSLPPPITEKIKTKNQSIDSNNSSNLTMIEIPKKYVYLKIKQNDLEPSQITGIVFNKDESEYMRWKSNWGLNAKLMKGYDVREKEIGKLTSHIYQKYNFELDLYPDSKIQVDILNGKNDLSIQNNNVLFYLVHNHHKSQKEEKWIDVCSMSKKNVVGRIYFDNNLYKINVFEEYKESMNLIVLALYFMIVLERNQ